MIVVSDASPLVSLATIDRLGMLRLLYGTILVPEAVHREVVDAGKGRPGSSEVDSADWIVVVEVTDRAAVASLRDVLDEREAESIVLAEESGADLLLVDERRGRAIATRRGIRVVGVLGVLVAAKDRGFLEAVGPVLDDLVARAGIWIGPGLRAEVLAAAGEGPPWTHPGPPG